ADGGPHVRNTCEIGGLKLLRLESKGRKRRRIYYTLSQ
ncbi:MAG: alanyl-tRNA editing protein AlaX, partial [Desulfurococcales archaeon]|nr:alanyl-tRNA editing protein AlaX [Desulfurococcales archaeon]